jgi:hypothetical protein
VQSDCVVRINPLDGRVLGWIWGQNLYDGPHPSVHIMNGIAFDILKHVNLPHEQSPYQVLITGKKWPKMYLMEVVEPEHQPDLRGYVVPPHCRSSDPDAEDMLYSTTLAMGSTAGLI